MSTNLPDAVARQQLQVDEIEAAIAAEVAPAAEPPPAEPAPEPPAPPPAAEPPAEDWKQKYLTLQGKYNAEVPVLREQVRTLEQQITELKRPPTAPPAPKPQADPVKLVTDKDADAFGADLIDLIRRAAREESAEEKARLQAEIEELRAKLPTLETKVDSVATAQTENSRDRYYAGLSGKVADYLEINASQAFLDWLAVTDPFTGAVRNDLLQDAFAKFDVTRTAAIFDAFKATQTPPPPTPPPEPKNELEAQVSPGTSKSQTTTPVEGKKIWTSTEVQDFFNSVTRGEFKGREKDAERIDAEIDLAFAENRVRA